MTGWLLLIVVLTNIGSDPIAQIMGWPAQKVFYVVRGIEGLFVFWLVSALAPKDKKFRYVWLGLCLWAMAESTMTSVCGGLDISWPMRPRLYEGLCDIHTGLPLAHASVLLSGLFALLYYLGVTRRDRGS